MTALLGGAANPLGAVVQFVHAPVDPVVDALAGDFTASAINADLHDALALLLPFESPWSRPLLAPCGEWTALLDNGIHGGDSTAPRSDFAASAGARSTVAR